MNVKARSTIAALAGVAMAFAFGVARGDEKPAASSGVKAAVADSQPLKITFRTIEPPAKGDNRVEAVVRRADGSPVTDATVAATFRMPAMPTMNMPEMRSTASLAHEGDGRYAGTGRLEMAGTWYVTVSVSRDGAPLGSSRFSVLAK